MALTTIPASLSATALTLTTAAQPNITSVGTLTGLTVSGNIAGTLTTAAQTNITSVGTLTGLVVNGNASIQTGALTLSGANPPLSISNSGDAKINFVRSSNTISYAMSSSASGGHGFYDNAGSTYDLYMKAGNVGIGTTSPASPLTINGSDPLITFENGESPHWQLGFENTQSDRFVIYDNNANAYRLVINSTGNVGIGGSTITDSNLLNLQGSGVSVNVGVVFNDTNTSKIFGIQNGGSTLKFFDYTASAERMRIDSSGNVGIGTSSITTFSGYKTLHFKNESGNAISLAESDGGVIAQTICDDATGVTIGSRSNHILRITTNDAERMRIDTSGNLGLGMAPTTNNISKSISLVNGGSIFGYGSGTYITGNSNYNGAWNTVATGPDSRILLDGNVIFSRSSSASAGSQGTVSESMRIDSTGRVGIFNSSPANYTGAGARSLVVGSNSSASDPHGITIVAGSSSTSNLAFTDNAGDGSANDYRGLFQYAHSDDYLRIFIASSESMRIDSSASSGHLQMGIFGVTGLNTTAAIHGVGNDAALVLSNGNLSTSNSSYGWAGRGNRYLTSNGTNWDFDGRDPALVIGQNTASDNRGQGIGIILHNESTTNGHYGPIVGWGTKSESNSYNTMYAYIVGKKTGSGVDTNWSKGELQFDTAGLKPNGSNAYMTDTPSMIIDDSGAVTKPHQPHIRLYGNSATRVQTQGSAFTAYVNFAISSQRGITFNSGNGLITLPVAGTYLIQYSFYLWMDNVGHGVNHSIALYRNSSMQQESIHEMVGISGSQLWDNTLSNSLILDCAAGDTIRFAGNADIYGGTVHTNASVYLLG